MMKKSILLTTAVLFVVITMASGCSTLGMGKSDDELVTETITAWKTAIEAEAIEDVMVLYSEDFSGSRGEDKAGVREMLGGFIDSGNLSEIEIGLEAMEVTIDSGVASASNIELSFPQGDMSLSFELKKEGKAWLLTSSDASQ